MFIEVTMWDEDRDFYYHLMLNVNYIERVVDNYHNRAIITMTSGQSIEVEENYKEILEKLNISNYDKTYIDEFFKSRS